MKLGYLDIITIIIYFFIILIAGLAFVKKNKTIRDYAVGEVIPPKNKRNYK